MAFMAVLLARPLRPARARGRLALVAGGVRGDRGTVGGAVRLVLWGGVKEVAGAWLIALVAALAPWTLEARGWRAVVPLAAACATLACVESLPGSVWLAPFFLAILALVAWRWSAELLWRAGAFALATAVLAIPAFVAFHRGGTTWRLPQRRRAREPVRPAERLPAVGIWPRVISARALPT